MNTTHTNHQHLAIIGGGLVGRLMAFQLAQHGYEISLFEQSTSAGENAAAYIAAAMLAPTAEAIEATPEVIELGKQSIPLWRKLRQQLQPQPIMLQENGSLIVWHGQDHALATEFQRHLTDPNAYQTWHAHDIAQHEPQLSGRFQHGFYLPSEGQLDGRQVLNALAHVLSQQPNVHLHWQTKWQSSLHTHTPFNGIIDCRGFGAKCAWNARLAAHHAFKQPAPSSQLRGVRGEVARVYAPEIQLNRPIRLLHPRYPLYIAPKENHVFVIGATQLESENDAPVRVRSGLELLSALYAIHPAFGEAEILEMKSGLRPTLNHHNPEIRYQIQPDKSTFQIQINGLFRHGFMISPAVTAAAIRLVTHLCESSPIPTHDEITSLPFIELSAGSLQPET